MGTKYAPIVLFVFARPEHTKSTLEALALNKLADQSDLIVYADAARNESEVLRVEAVRALVHSAKGFSSISVVERTTNYGLARNVIEGVSEVCQRYGRVIVLEDDLVTSPYFLLYMNDALDLYADSVNVGSISGYSYPTKGRLPALFFSRHGTSWGWATWSRSWQEFDPDGFTLLRKLEESGELNTFDFDGAYEFSRMLKQWCEKKNNSWAIRWYASFFLKGRLTLFPGKSLVLNIGHDGSGTHCGISEVFSSDIAQEQIKVELIPCVEHQGARAEIRNYFQSIRTGIFKRFLGRVYRGLSLFKLLTKWV